MFNRYHIYILIVLLLLCSCNIKSSEPILVLNGVKGDTINVDAPPYQCRIIPVITGGKIEDRDISVTAWYLNNRLINKDPILTHTFKKPGIYEVTCLVYNRTGKSFQKKVVITVKENLLPECDFTFEPEEARIGELVFFTPVCVDSDGRISRYKWYYGDGSKDTSGRHRYNAAGIYTVMLSATDNRGSTVEVKKDISIFH